MQLIFYKFNIEMIGIEPAHIKESNDNSKNVPNNLIEIIRSKPYK